MNDRGSKVTGIWRIWFHYSEVDQCDSNGLDFWRKIEFGQKRSDVRQRWSRDFSRVGGVEWRVVYLGKLDFQSDKQEFSLRGVKSNKISSHICPIRIYKNKAHFSSNLVLSSFDNPKRLWQTVNKLVHLNHLHPYLPLLQLSLCRQLRFLLHKQNIQPPSVSL